MKSTVITLFPEMIQQTCSYGIVGQAQKKNLIQIQTINPRQFTSDVHKTVDDRPFGGGDGMVMLAEPLVRAMESLSTGEKYHVVYVSPQGRTLDEEKVIELSKHSHLVLICGRYGGIDQRFLNRYVDEEVSIGDYVLSGGELAACTIIDACARKIPGVLGHENSASEDSFAGEGLLEAPLFTRPQETLDQKVPTILSSGHHAKISEWRKRVSQLVTLQKRPDLLMQSSLSRREVSQLVSFWRELSPEDQQALGLHTMSEKDFEMLLPLPEDLR